MQMPLTFCIKNSKLICRKESKNMHHFDYSFLDKGLLPAGLVSTQSNGFESKRTV